MLVGSTRAHGPLGQPNLEKARQNAPNNMVSNKSGWHCPTLRDDFWSLVRIWCSEVAPSWTDKPCYYSYSLNFIRETMNHLGFVSKQSRRAIFPFGSVPSKYFHTRLQWIIDSDVLQGPRFDIRFLDFTWRDNVSIGRYI